MLTFFRPLQVVGFAFAGICNAEQRLHVASGQLLMIAMNDLARRPWHTYCWKMLCLGKPAKLRAAENSPNKGIDHMKKLLIAALALTSLATFSAQAITTKLWKLPDPATYLAAPGTVPVTTPDVVFQSPTALTYNLQGTVGDWIATGGGTSITEYTANTLNSLMSDGTIGTLVQMKGCITVTSGQQFTFTHDDGMYLGINGIDLGFYADPTSPLSETKAYTGAAGTFAFELVYTENHSGPAVLEGNLPGAFNCPDGGTTLALLGVAMSGMVWIRRKIS